MDPSIERFGAKKRVMICVAYVVVVVIVVCIVPSGTALTTEGIQCTLLLYHNKCSNF